MLSRHLRLPQQARRYIKKKPLMTTWVIFMHIANPIYDSVFKFLLEDQTSAVLLLSSIIGESIESLEFLPQENIVQLERRALTVYRLDFAAKIKTEQGYKQVLIEVQKAKLPSDVMRFRRYLGEQYAKKSNTYLIEYNGIQQKIPLPIISIYFLGYSLEKIKTPIIKVNRRYYDLVNQEEIQQTEAFIESLTHDSYVIQIAELHQAHRNELEQLLLIFAQHQQLATDEHILEIDEQSYPEKYRPLMRRLQQAAQEPDVRKTMDAEDEILQDLQAMEQVIADKDQLLAAQAKLIAELKQQLKQDF